MPSLSLKIADIVIRIDSEIELDRFTDIDFYRAYFIRPQKMAHCRLKVVTRKPLLRLPQEHIFSPSKNWRLYRQENKYILLDGRPLRRDNPDSLIIFNSTFTKGVVYKRHITELFRRLLDQFILINLLSLKQGFLLHASGVVWQGKGLAFVGQSRAGKSTILKLFSRHLRQDNLLCDDRLAIRKDKKSWFIYGTPWYGEVAGSSPKKAPLKALFMIKQSPTNYLAPISQAEAYRQLLRNGLLPFWDKPAMIKVLCTLKQITGQVPVYELGFRPDQSIIELIKKEL